MLPRVLILAAIGVFSSVSQGAAQSTSLWLADRVAEPSTEIALTNLLQEVSGLAAGKGARVYAHNDEHAIVYEIDLAAERVVAAFALGGPPTVAGDFEGIEFYDGRIYLLTSTGFLYEASEGENRERVRFNIYDTGAGDTCEIEGLSRGPQAGDFLLICKRSLKAEFKESLRIYKWRLSAREVVSDPWLEIRFSELEGVSAPGFRPSGIEWDADREEILIVSARDRTLLRLSQRGELIEKTTLPAEQHPQAEGIALLGNGDLVIADEGRGRSRAGMLHIYERN